MVQPDSELVGIPTSKPIRPCGCGNAKPVLQVIHRDPWVAFILCRRCGKRGPFERTSQATWAAWDMMQQLTEAMSAEPEEAPSCQPSTPKGA
jgi:hypothetical protein